MGYFVKDNIIFTDDTNNNELYYIIADEIGDLILNAQTEIVALSHSSQDYHWVTIPAVLAALAVGDADVFLDGFIARCRVVVGTFPG
ncbi:hypothetical protein ACB524_004355 [Salmonella enterica]